jgi:hypothetical protein
MWCNEALFIACRCNLAHGTRSSNQRWDALLADVCGPVSTSATGQQSLFRLFLEDCTPLLTALPLTTSHCGLMILVNECMHSLQNLETLESRGPYGMLAKLACGQL